MTYNQKMRFIPRANTNKLNIVILFFLFAILFRFYVGRYNLCAACYFVNAFNRCIDVSIVLSFSSCSLSNEVCFVCVGFTLFLFSRT